MLAYLIRAELERGLKTALRPVIPYLRMLVTGVTFVIVSIGAYLFAFLFGSLGLFFTLIEQANPAEAAFWLAAAWLIIGLLLTLVGSSRLRPPR